MSSLCHFMTSDKLFMLSEPQMPHLYNTEVKLIISISDDYGNDTDDRLH